MSEKLKEREPDSDGGGSLPETNIANLKSRRDAGADLLAAGADAISKALSGNSEAFLHATRQTGGQ